MATTATQWSVVTGSTGGLGTEIVKILAARGRNLILLNRSETKSQTQRDALLALHPSLLIETVTADLMDSGKIATAIEKIKALPGRVDFLFNNSGVLTAEKVLSQQGYESQFAVNVLAGYQLTWGLKGKMARSATETAGMVIMLSSSAANAPKSLDLDALANPTSVGGLMSTYAQTKLATTALAPALADQLKEANILIRAIDPGATKTAMTTGGNTAMPKILQWLAPLLFKPADKQAMKLIDAVEPAALGGQTGVFVFNGKIKKMPPSAADKRTQTALLSRLEDALSGVAASSATSYT
ncbi:MAG: SDR family NAD(P)-dependent oxidoreductase [Pseudomonadota bacterium]